MILSRAANRKFAYYSLLILGPLGVFVFSNAIIEHKDFLKDSEEVLATIERVETKVGSKGRTRKQLKIVYSPKSSRKVYRSELYLENYEYDNLEDPKRILVRASTKNPTKVRQDGHARNLWIGLGVVSLASLLAYAHLANSWLKSRRDAIQTSLPLEEIGAQSAELVRKEAEETHKPAIREVSPPKVRPDELVKLCSDAQGKIRVLYRDNNYMPFTREDFTDIEAAKRFAEDKATSMNTELIMVTI